MCETVCAGACGTAGARARAAASASGQQAAAALMQCAVVVRAATARDMEARAELVRHSIIEYDFDAFLTFFFQERIRKEMCGFVAEYRGPLVADPRLLRTPVVQAGDAGGPGGETSGGPGGETSAGLHARLVGTVSLSECWGPRRSAWLHALGVAPAWRRRGVGSALLTACRAHALGAGLESLEAVTSELQAAARGLLHTAGWQLRGSYQRPVLGAALTLSMSQLGMELPAQ